MTLNRSYRRVGSAPRRWRERASRFSCTRTAKPTAQKPVPHACAASTSVKKPKLVCYSTLMTAHFHRTRRKLVRGVRVHLEDKKRSQATHSGHQRQQRLYSLHQASQSSSSLNQLSQSPCCCDRPRAASPSRHASRAARAAPRPTSAIEPSRRKRRPAS